MKDILFGFLAVLVNPFAVLSKASGWRMWAAAIAISLACHNWYVGIAFFYIALWVVNDILNHIVK